MKRKKILLVDDELGFANMMKLYLEKAGDYEVTTENNPLEALNIAKSFKPDIIILDVVMPDMDGPDLAAKIKSDVSFKNVPIVFLTAIVEKDQETEINGSIGGQHFIAKPVTGEVLLAAIKKYIG